MVINQAVCEGCGDCSRISNCLSVLPVETEFGERREIHQSSCNKDFSCLEGDCPSFLTIVPADSARTGAPGRTGAPARRDRRARPSLPAGDLPEPALAPVDGRYSVYTTGIGGTGIVTANRLLAHAALAAGFVVQGVDQTGLSQKAGAVVSHLHVGRTDADITTATVPDGGADLYLSGDLLQAAVGQAPGKVRPGRTWAVVDADLVPTAGMLQGTPGVDHGRLSAAVRDVGRRRPHGAVRHERARRAGLRHPPARQRRAARHRLASSARCRCRPRRSSTPSRPRARRRATNLEAFRWGRWIVADPGAVEAALAGAGGSGGARRRRGSGAQSALWDPVAARRRPPPPGSSTPARCPPTCARCSSAAPPRWSTTRAAPWPGDGSTSSPGPPPSTTPTTTGRSPTAVAEGWFQVLTYKDEYEVARLHLRLDLDDVAAGLGLDGGYKVQYQLHPPALRRLGRERKIALRRRRRPDRRSGPWRPCAGCGARRSTSFGSAATGGRSAGWPTSTASWSPAPLDALTPETYDDAVALAASIQSVRGYEDIKSEAIARWRADVGLSST